MKEDRPRSDALVFLGATGDLAYKKIFPALQAIARRGQLDFPVVGVAKSGYTREQLVERARASVTEYGGLDEKAFDVLARKLDYVDGDYNDIDTFRRLRKALGDKQRPTHYLAIPPSLFPTVVEKLSAAGCAQDARAPTRACNPRHKRPARRPAPPHAAANTSFPTPAGPWTRCCRAAKGISGRPF